MVILNKDTKSESLPLDIGIPQGSILGPLLFIIFINDMPNIVKNTNHTIVNYADDTNLLLIAKNFNELLTEGKKYTDVLCNWFNTNKLVLNVNKTQSTIFQSKGSNNLITEINFENVNFMITREVKCLGIILDNFLNWKQHITYLNSRLNNVIYSFRILKNNVTQNSLKTVYYANFESLVRYGIIFWGQSTDIVKTFRLQKNAIRLIFNLKQKQSCRQIFKNNRILTLVALYILECLLFNFKNKTLFQDCEQNHSHNTRHQNYTYPKHKLNITENSPYYFSLKLFNSLPQMYKNINDIKKFKTHIFDFLINIEPYNLQEYFYYCKK